MFKIVFLVASFIFALPTWNDSIKTSSKISVLSGCYIDTTLNHVELDRMNVGVPHGYTYSATAVFEKDSIRKDSVYDVAFPEMTGTMELWVNGSFSDSGYIGNVFDQYAANRNHIVVRSYGQYGKSAQVHFYDASTSSYTYSCNISVAKDKWNFLAVTWDMNAGVAAVYVNGVLAHSGTVKNSNWIADGQIVSFGNGFSGNVSHVRILSEALTLSEIRKDFGEGYTSNGSFASIPVVPLSISAWESLEWRFSAPAGCSLRVFIEDSSNQGWNTIPNSFLAGNEDGFINSPVELGSMPVADIPRIRLRAVLKTTDSTKTPEFMGWTVKWQSNDNHPRLYMNDSVVASIRFSVAARKEPYAAYYGDIRQRAVGLLGKIPPSRNSSTMLDDALSRGVAWDLVTLLTAAVISDSLPFKLAAGRFVDSIIAYPRWGTNRSLGAGHILFSLSLAYDWLHEYWSDSLKRSMENKIIVYGDTLRRFASGSTAYLHNHNHVCFSGVMAAAVATYNVNPLANEWATHCRNNFTSGIEYLSPDGVSVEDLAYYTYGLEAMLRYFAIEESFLNIDRVAVTEWFENTWLYRLYGSQPKIWEIAILGDCPNTDYYGPGYMFYRLASKFRNSFAQQLAYDITSNQIQRNMVSGRIDFRNLIWYDSTVVPLNYSTLPTYKLFPDMGFFSSRSAWNDTDACFFATEAAPPMGQLFYGKALYDMGSSHQHPDKGHFLLKAFDTDLAIDDGYSYRKLTASHNVVTFDSGRGQTGEGFTWYRGHNFIPYLNRVGFVHNDFSDTFEYLVADLTHAYLPALGLKKYLRHFIFIKKRALLITDEIEIDSVRNIEWRLHSDTLASYVASDSTLQMKHNVKRGGFLLEELSRIRSDTLLFGTYEQFDTVQLETRINVHGCKNQQLMLVKKGLQARFDVLIRPFTGTAPEKALAMFAENDTLKITTDDFNLAFHAGGRNISIDTPLVSGSSKVAALEHSLEINPNPFNPSVKVYLVLPDKAHVRINVFDCNGSYIRELANETFVSGGHFVVWDGSTVSGKNAASGLYFIVLESNERRITRKVSLVR